MQSERLYDSNTMEKIDFIHIEDSEQWQEIVRELIEGNTEFHNFVSVTRVEDAVRILRKKPTVIVVDFELDAVTNSFEGLHWLIDNAPQAIRENTEVLVLSAHTSSAINSILVSRGIRSDQIFDKRTTFEEGFLQAISRAVFRLHAHQPETSAISKVSPMSSGKPCVFISHSSKDSAFASRISEDIRSAGYCIWKAPESIMPGEGWVEAIQNGLQTSSYVVLVVSPQSTASKWVNLEMNLAIQLERENKLTIIPIYYQESAVPLLWQYFQAIDFKADYKNPIGALIKRLQDLTGSDSI